MIDFEFVLNGREATDAEKAWLDDIKRRVQPEVDRAWMELICFGSTVIGGAAGGGEHGKQVKPGPPPPSILDHS